MHTDRIQELFSGNFLVDPKEFKSKLDSIKAFVFDWDGVFNNGVKNENSSSSFSEIEAMGTNLLRFNHFLRKGTVPIVAIISGEKNADAVKLATREHFDSIYSGYKIKTDALKHLCVSKNIEHSEIAFFFDDVLDLSVAELVGLRIMIGRKCNPLLLEYVINNKLADYITRSDGGNHGLREAIELLMGKSGMFDETITHRIHFDEVYKRYLHLRNLPETLINNC